MIVIQVGIASEHLFDDRFDVAMEVGWESAGPAYPIVFGRGEGLIQV